MNWQTKKGSQPDVDALAGGATGLLILLVIIFCCCPCQDLLNKLLRQQSPAAQARYVISSSRTRSQKAAQQQGAIKKERRFLPFLLLLRLQASRRLAEKEGFVPRRMPKGKRNLTLTQPDVDGAVCLFCIQQYAVFTPVSVLHKLLMQQSPAAQARYVISFSRTRSETTALQKEKKKKGCRFCNLFLLRPHASSRFGGERGI